MFTPSVPPDSAAPQRITAKRFAELLRRLPEPRYVRGSGGERLENPHVVSRRLHGVLVRGGERRHFAVALPASSKPGQAIELYSWGVQFVGRSPGRIFWPECVTTADLLPSEAEDEEAERRRLVAHYVSTPEVLARRRNGGYAPLDDAVQDVADEQRRRRAEIRADPLLAPLAKRYGVDAVLAQLAINEDDARRWRGRHAAQHSREALRSAEKAMRKHPPRAFCMVLGEGCAAWLRATERGTDATEHRARAEKEAERFGLSFIPYASKP